MTRILLVPLSIALLTLNTGCDALAFLFQPNSVAVTVINEASGTVDGEIFISEQQDIPRALLLEVDKDIVDHLGERIDVTVEAGAQTAFRRSCNDLQAIVVGDAELSLILPGVGPNADSDVLRDGDDFNCGDEIQIIFHETGGNFDVDMVVIHSGIDLVSG